MNSKINHYKEVFIMRNEMEQIRKDNGHVSVSPPKAFAGEGMTVKVTYTVDEVPIFPNGVLRFTIPFGFTLPQVDTPVLPGYTTAITNKLGSAAHVFIKKGNWAKRGPKRTKEENVSEHVGTHVWVRIKGYTLTKGDTVTVTFGDISYGLDGFMNAPRTIGPIQFDVAIDSTGRMEAPYSGYYLTENPPIMEIIPLEANKLEITIPSNIEKDIPFKVVIFASDKYFNLAMGYEGKVTLYNKNKKIKDIIFKSEDKGVIHTNITLDIDEIVYINAEDKENNLKGKSNPAVVNYENKYSWGDLHGHTAIQWGKGSGRSYYEFASVVANLDFCSLTDPCAGRYTNDNETSKDSASCYMTDEKWKLIQTINDEYNKNGEFVTLLGYEYHNDAPNPEFGGDRNVYFESNDEPILRCVDEGSYSPSELWEKLPKSKAITVPHHTAKAAMLGSWDVHNEEIQRLVEIYSSWGSSECEDTDRPIIGGGKYDIHSVQYALSKGYKLGFVAGSDTHSGVPGYAHWVFPITYNSYRGGLTCALTNDLTREGIFKAMWNRKVYATTGERILLDFNVNGYNMGDELEVERNSPRTIKINVVGTDDIDRIEVISNGNIFYCVEGSGTKKTIEITDNSALMDNFKYYYVKVLQKNKSMAWSSPIWVVNKN